MKRWNSASASPAPPALFQRLLPSHNRLDEPVRLFRRHEDLVRIVQAERREVDEEMVLVRQREGDGVDLGTALEHGLTHRVRRVLYAATVVIGERLEHDLPGARADLAV